jgi:hypothetical protein
MSHSLSLLSLVALFSACSGCSAQPPKTLTHDADAGACAVPVIPACDLAPPAPAPAAGFRNVASRLAAAAGPANHRGRDLFLNPDDPQWVIGKLAYGAIDKDLEGEDVDVYLLRLCEGDWEKLNDAPVRTTADGEHATVEGVEDSGGRIYFSIPAAKKLAPGRHRLHLRVRGDNSGTDAFVEVVPAGAPIFISDVDGTLTISENEEFSALLAGDLPPANDHAAAMFRILVKKGFRPIYVTARPEFLVQRTRDFLRSNDFPPGVVHTTLGLTGALGDAASNYKTGELQGLAGKGLVPSYGFGNTATDAVAYENGKLLPLKQRVFFKFDDAKFGGRRIESYGELQAELDALSQVCR